MYPKIDRDGVVKYHIRPLTGLTKKQRWIVSLIEEMGYKCYWVEEDIFPPRILNADRVAFLHYEQTCTEEELHSILALTDHKFKKVLVSKSAYKYFKQNGETPDLTESLIHEAVHVFLWPTKMVETDSHGFNFKCLYTYLIIKYLNFYRADPKLILEEKDVRPIAEKILKEAGVYP